MIPKIWCWLFGHERRFKKWLEDCSNGQDYIYTWEYYDTCPRCGTPLKEKK